jgi:hypothetical protein
MKPASLKPLTDGIDSVHLVSGGAGRQQSDHWQGPRLRVRCERPASRTAKEGNELAPPHEWPGVFPEPLEACRPLNEELKLRMESAKEYLRLLRDFNLHEHEERSRLIVRIIKEEVQGQRIVKDWLKQHGMERITQ